MILMAIPISPHQEAENMDRYAAQALKEYNSEENIIRQGGINGQPFWNVFASQFMYIPALSFSKIPGAKTYIYTATDSEGKTLSFTAEGPCAPLTPIWAALAPGLVELKVEAIHKRSEKVFSAGARSFYKMAPFPGREALPPRACSYRECARKAFGYVFNDPITQYWLTHGKPKPDYYHNVYPSKTASSIITAMLAYRKIEPAHKAAALKLAANAADYLLSITYGADSALAGLPPTYSFAGLDKAIVDANAPAADGRKHTVMMIYPASVGNAYLQLEKALGDEKYGKAALRIAEYYRSNVLPNGSWYLQVSEKTGKKEADNCCGSFGILKFLHNIYEKTNDESYRQLERDYFAYLSKARLENYNWEGQFEDSVLSSNYSNLTHIDANNMIDYIVHNLTDDPQMLKQAKELMRFVEDQFVVWGDFPEWNSYYDGQERWYSPAVLEQYAWYVPIDGSTATVLNAFLNLYSVTGDRLYLEKACALGDSITRMQNPESGVIPTHWVTTDCSTVLKNFWINCHIGTAFRMLTLAEATGEIA